MENNEIQQFSSEKFNKKYKDIFELCPIPYMVVGHLGNILQFNNAAAYTFGISHKPVGSASIFQILTKESESQFRLLFKQAFELREKQELELVFINHKREKIIAKTNFVSYFDGDKNQDLCLMTMVDITQRKQIELSLLQSERLLLHSQKIANLGSWDWNIQTNETYWSDQLYEIYGRRKEDGVPHIDDWTNTIHPDDREYLVQNIENALKGIQKYDVEYRIFKKNNGELRIIHAIGEVVYDKEGQPLRLFGVAQDVTDRKNKEEQLKELNNTKDKFFQS